MAIFTAGFIYGQNISEKMFSSELKKLDLVIAGPIAWHDRLTVAEPVDLDQFPWIMTPADCPFHKVASQLFKTHDLHPDQVVMVDHDTTIKSMIKAGAGISLLLEQDILPEEIEESLTIWKKEQLSLTLSIACLKRRRDEQMLRTLVSALSGVWAD
jgi:DNA-binding transcriptional LysR family regulator